MATKAEVPISEELVEAIRDFPVQRELEHCGQTFAVSPFDIYFKCPACGQELKVRSFSGGVEIEDIFDAVFA